jgi:hypothetical protein
VPRPERSPIQLTRGGRDIKKIVTTYPFDRVKKRSIFMTEDTGATPSLEGSRAIAEYMREGGFVFEYVDVDGNHGSMVPMVWPRVFAFFDRYK